MRGRKIVQENKDGGTASEMLVHVNGLNQPDSLAGATSGSEQSTHRISNDKLREAANPTGTNQLEQESDTHAKAKTDGSGAAETAAVYSTQQPAGSGGAGGAQLGGGQSHHSLNNGSELGGNRDILHSGSNF